MAKIKQKIFTLLNKMCRFFYPFHIKNTVKSIDFIIKNNVSLCRFGEGEISLLARKKDLKFQDYDEELAFRMKRILKSKNKNVIVGIPFAIKSTKHLNDRAKTFWEDDLSFSSIEWAKYTSICKKYYDSLMTRPYIDLNDRTKTPFIYKKWMSIWDKKDVLIVEGAETRLGVGNDLLAGCKSIKRILCPSKNAYSKYNKIINAVRDVGKNYLVLIALGPTASVLAFDLANDGYQALDIGHIDIEYEWYKMGANEPVKIDTKFTNEAKGGDVVSDINNSEYRTQIIKVID